MKLIHLKSIQAAIILIVLGASSCNNNGSQEANSSSRDSVISRKSDSISKGNLSNSPNTSTGDTVNTGNSANGSIRTNSYNSGVNHKWSLVITPSTTKSYLDSIQAQWKRKNIDLNISTLKYDAGNLVKIKGSVTINTKAGNHASGEFKSENPVAIKIKVDDSPNVIIKAN
jgi:hypothetical protein